MTKEKTYIFETSKGFTLDGKGNTPKKAFCKAKKDLDNFNSSNLSSKKIPTGNLTGRYNIYGKDDTVPTGYFPKKIKVTKGC